MTRLPWSFSLPDGSIPSLQQFADYSLGFPTPALAPFEVAACGFSPWWAVSPCIYLLVSPMCGAVIYLWPHRFSVCRERCSCFSLLSFLLDGMDWWLPSFLHASPVFCFVCFTKIMVWNNTRLLSHRFVDQKSGRNWLVLCSVSQEPEIQVSRLHFHLILRFLFHAHYSSWQNAFAVVVGLRSLLLVLPVTRTLAPFLTWPPPWSDGTGALTLLMLHSGVLSSSSLHSF